MLMIIIGSGGSTPNGLQAENRRIKVNASSPTRRFDIHCTIRSYSVNPGTRRAVPNSCLKCGVRVSKN